jgi:hypothetical protein
MQTLKKAVHVRRTIDQIKDLAKSTGATVKHIKAMLKDIYKNETVYKNDQYVVHCREVCDGNMIHLSLRRTDREPVTDWRDKQAIKNQLVGEECEAVEIFPAESRLMDTANQYHLWVFKDPAYRIPFGFDEGRVVSDVSAGGAIQRPLGEVL